MAFRQYTKCVDIEHFDPKKPQIQAVRAATLAILPLAAVAAILRIMGVIGWWFLPLLGWIFLLVGIVRFCYWWLYGRLICIPASADHPTDDAGNHLAIGRLINTEPPGSGSFIDNIDNDYSIGILLCPLHLGAGRSDVVGQSPYGYLVDEQSVTKDRNLPYAGEQAVCPNDPASRPSEVLHCEFEGRGMYDMYLAGVAALLLAVATFIAYALPVTGWVPFILAVLSILAIPIGWLIGKVDVGDPSDVNPNIGKLDPCADTLIIKGRWVYDSLHTGAYELHPVTFCRKANCDATEESLASGD